MSIITVCNNFFLQLVGTSLYTVDIIDGKPFEQYVGEVEIDESDVLSYYNNLEAGLR